MQKSFGVAVVVAAASLFISTVAHAVDAVWTSGTGNWSTQNAATLGWAGTLPDGIGDTGTYDTTGKGSATTVQDLTGTRTVGKLEITGSGNSSWQITLAAGKNLVMNQDGGGPLTAILSNTQTNGTGGNPSLIINSGAGQIVLNDDLLISNTGASIRTGGSIQIDPQFVGAGNITFFNSGSNDPLKGQIALQRTGPGGSNFAGNSTIAKGAVTFTRGDRFTPTASNVVTIGRSDGDASLYFVGGSLGNIENNLVSAANTGGTNVFGTTAAATGLVNIKSSSSQTLPKSLVTLNGDLTFSVGGTGLLQIGDPIVGVGKLTKIGPGPMRVTNANTYSGGTVVDAGSLSVGHTDAINNGFGFYDATDGTLGKGNVTVNSTATELLIESSVASVDVIHNLANLLLAGGAGVGHANVDFGVSEIVGGLYFNGVPQLNGVYDSTTSPDYISGSGSITVVNTDPDFDNDFDVDGNDFLIWQRNLGVGTNNATGDANGSGTVDADDLLAWKNKFGLPLAATAVAAAGAVPEPATALMALAAAGLALAATRRK